MKIPFLDLQAQHRPIREQVLAEAVRVIDSQAFILGEDVASLEREIAVYCGTRFAIGCASGSDALFLALLALDIGAGDEVLTTPYTFFATAGAIVRAGAAPVFVDVDGATFNMDANLVAAVLDAHPRVRAIIPIHLFGGCADMDPLLRLAAARGIPVIEDAAQAIGAEYNGRRAGSLGRVACFSFYPTKNLGAYGDAGILTTDDEALAARLSALRVHGSHRKYYHEWVGVNSRLDALQAAVLRVKLRYLDEWTRGRQSNAGCYFASLDGLSISLPRPASWQTRHIFNQFVICSSRRDDLQAWLRERGIGTDIYYPVPLHLQDCFRYLGYKAGDFPVSERLASQSLALPIYAELPAEHQRFICEALAEFDRQV